MNLSTKRIVVTGGAGFLGSFIVEKLKAQGCESIVVPRSDQYDLRDRDAIIRLYEKAKPELVIHLAAVVGGIGINRRHPGKFFYDNAIMGIELLEYARRYGVEKFVAAGTVCAYPKFATIPFKEDEIWNGYPEETNAPYGLAKKMMLVQAQAYRREYGTNIIYLLPVNLYGPRDNFDLESSHVIPGLIRKFVEAKESSAPAVQAWGTGAATREFLYVEDAAEAFIRAAEVYEKPDPINIGSGQEISIRDLVEMIRQLVGYGGAVEWDANLPDGQPRRCLDTSRARKELGWEAATSLRDGLEKTVAWFVNTRAK